MPNIGAHTFSSEGTSSNDSETRDMGESVSIAAVTAGDGCNSGGWRV